MVTVKPVQCIKTFSDCKAGDLIYHCNPLGASPNRLGLIIKGENDRAAVLYLQPIELKIVSDPQNQTAVVLDGTVEIEVDYKSATSKTDSNRVLIFDDDRCPLRFNCTANQIVLLDLHTCRMRVCSENTPMPPLAFSNWTLLLDLNGREIRQLNCLY
jgi:hypothetical protein